MQKSAPPRIAIIKLSVRARQNRPLLPSGSRRVQQCDIGKDNAMGEGHAPMAEYTALIEQLCAKRSTLVQAMATNPEQIRDLSRLRLVAPQMDCPHHAA